MCNPKAQDRSVVLAINGARVSLPPGGDPSQSLAEFIRTQTRFTGTKIACGEGGCGACAVEVSSLDAWSGEVRTISLNSCLATVGSLDGMSITTVEGIGGSSALHGVQERIAQFHGSQCGFCTPGIVVACHATLLRAAERGTKATPGDLQTGLDGNLCRCTGYRPILDACKSMAGAIDIEELGIVSAGCTHEPVLVVPPCAAQWPDFLRRRTPLDATCSTGRPWPEVGGSGKTWATPTSLAQLFSAMDHYSGKDPRLLAGNTGAGVYKNWPHDDVVIDLKRVQELRMLHYREGGLEVGGAVTLGELIEGLRGCTDPARVEPWRRMALHVERIAGTHVRSAATVGGNLALSLQRALESDLVTLLMGCGAKVRVASFAGSRWMAVEEFCTDRGLAGSLGIMEVVTSVYIPIATPGDVFWSHKVAHRFHNSHAIVNAAVYLPASEADATSRVRVVVGHYDNVKMGKGTWHVGRVLEAERLLACRPLSPVALAGALEAVVRHVAATGADDYTVQCAEGVLFSALAPHVPQGSGLSARLQQIFLVQSYDVPTIASGKQTWQDNSGGTAPVGLPVEKDAVRLQVSGEAMYTSDIGAGAAQLFAAPVTSSEALADVESIDASDAREIAGVVAFIGPDDVPVGGHNEVFDDLIFAEGRVHYVGQRLGLIVATSQSTAERAAALVRVRYCKPSSLGGPILSIAAAMKAGSFHDPEALRPDPEGRDEKVQALEQALADAPHVIRGGKYSIGSQFHVYMEPQAAVAQPDEGGTIVVHSATQSLDTVQRAVAHALGVTVNKVTVVCRRVGGAFGGRDETAIEYDVGFDQRGRLLGLRLKVHLLAGWAQDLASDDGMLLKDSAGMAYAIPHMLVDVKLCKTNLPARTIVRGPGFLQSVMVIEQVLEHVASVLGMDPRDVKELNFLTAPKECLPSDCDTGSHSAEASAGTGLDVFEKRPCVGSSALRPDGVPMEGEESWMRTAGGALFKTKLFTLPRIWKQLQEEAGYDRRVAAAACFNRDNVWRKRGVSITPVRFDVSPAAMSASVHIYCDGSILVQSGGIEMGQGLTTKMKQVASMELGAVLGTPLPLESIRIGDACSDSHPNNGSTWSSTGSESSCAAVRIACQKLRLQLSPLALQVGHVQLTWNRLIAHLQADMNGFSPSKICLSGHAWYDGSGTAPGGGSTGRKLEYVAFGAAVCEVEFDVLTGEKLVLQADILYDCGRSINPAADVGQVEGAFVMGMGLQTEEEVVVDDYTGHLISDSTWNYKIPTAACIPRRLNVMFLKDSPNPRGILSSKASGEPTLMLSTGVLSALQLAAAAARRDLAALQLTGVSVEEMSASSFAPFELDSISSFVGGDIGFIYGAAPVRERNTLQHTSAAINVDRVSRLSGTFQALSAPATTVKMKQSVGHLSIANLIRNIIKADGIVA